MIIIIAIIIELFCGFIFLPKYSTTEEFSLICIIINSFLYCIFTLQKFNLYKNIVLVAYILRLVLLLCSYYQLFPIIHDGADSEDFNRVAIYNVLTNHWIAHSNYSLIITIIYHIIGFQRLFVQYLNVLLGMGTIFMLYKTLLILNIEKRTQYIFMGFICFVPHFIIFSSILLREELMIFSISISVLFFIKWIKKNNLYFFLISCCFILFSSWLHSGAIGILVGYFISYSLYEHKTKKIKITIGSIITISFCIFLFLILIKTGLFSAYFNKVLESEDEASALYAKVSGISEGGSRYLTWININSPIQMLLFSPLKMFYLLYSPIPFDWRGITDIIAFCFSSVPYLYISWIVISRIKKMKNKENKCIVKFLLIAFLLTVFIYAFGVYASGPAMRHRTKMLPILIVAAAIVYDDTKNKKENNKHIKYIR